jgi:hypothetical protein
MEVYRAVLSYSAWQRAVWAAGEGYDGNAHLFRAVELGNLDLCKILIGLLFFCF